jgi:hypothetical protein
LPRGCVLLLLLLPWLLWLLPRDCMLLLLLLPSPRGCGLFLLLLPWLLPASPLGEPTGVAGCPAAHHPATPGPQHLLLLPLVLRACLLLLLLRGYLLLQLLLMLLLLLPLLPLWEVAASQEVGAGSGG